MFVLVTVVVMVILVMVMSARVMRWPANSILPVFTTRAKICNRISALTDLNNLITYFLHANRRNARARFQTIHHR